MCQCDDNPGMASRAFAAGADASAVRIAELEAALRTYHQWHLSLDEDVEGYLESKLFQQASAAMPSLKTES